MIAGFLLGLLLAAQPGKDVFEKRCGGCHAVDENRMGPKLRGVIGRKAGVSGDFPYSDALKGSQLVWTAETLDKWLADPDALVPQNDMSFQTPKREERAAIIEYLGTLRQTALLNAPPRTPLHCSHTGTARHSVTIALLADQ